MALYLYQNNYHISSYSFLGNYSFLNLEIVANSNSYCNISIFYLKYGFHKKSFILNETLVSCPFPSSLLGGLHCWWVQQQTHPKVRMEMGN